jgi:hypothetical protein
MLQVCGHSSWWPVHTPKPSDSTTGGSALPAAAAEANAQPAAQQEQSPQQAGSGAANVATPADATATATPAQTLAAQRPELAAADSSAAAGGAAAWEFPVAAASPAAAPPAGNGYELPWDSEDVAAGSSAAESMPASPGAAGVPTAAACAAQQEAASEAVAAHAADPATATAAESSPAAVAAAAAAAQLGSAQAPIAAASVAAPPPMTTLETADASAEQFAAAAPQAAHAVAAAAPRAGVATLDPSALAAMPEEYVLCSTATATPAATHHPQPAEQLRSEPQTLAAPPTAGSSPAAGGDDAPGPAAGAAGPEARLAATAASGCADEDRAGLHMLSGRPAAAAVPLVVVPTGARPVTSDRQPAAVGPELPPGAAVLLAPCAACAKTSMITPAADNVNIMRDNFLFTCLHLLLHVGASDLCKPAQAQPAAAAPDGTPMPVSQSEAAAERNAQPLTGHAAAMSTAALGADVGPESSHLQPAAQQQQQQQQPAGLALQQPAKEGSVVQHCQQQQQGPSEAAQEDAASPAGGSALTLAEQPDAAEAGLNSDDAVDLRAPPVIDIELAASAPASAGPPPGVTPSAAPAAAMGLPHHAHAEQGSDPRAELAAVDEQLVELQRPRKRRRRGNWAKVGRNWVLH